jgi:hypothetical protein
LLKYSVKTGILILVFASIYPAQPAQALGCARVKATVKSLGANSSLADAKSATNMVTAYKTAFENPKCVTSKELVEMKSAAKDLIIECSKPNGVYKDLFSKPVFTAFCGGFLKLAKYTK